MSESMVERVARAIEVAQWADLKSTSEQMARAAIAAMREPTMQMMDGAIENLEHQYDASPEWEEAKDVIEGLSLVHIYHSMIDAALRGEKR